MLEERDAGVDVRHPVQRRQVRGREVLAEDRGAEEEVQEAPVRDAEDAFARRARRSRRSCTRATRADDRRERLGARLGVIGRRAPASRRRGPCPCSTARRRGRRRTGGPRAGPRRSRTAGPAPRRCACAVSCARPYGLARIASMPSPRSRSPTPRACSQPRSDRRSPSSGSACIVRSATLATRLAVAREVDDGHAHVSQEELVHARLPRDLRVEGDHEHVVLARGDGMPVDRRQDLDARRRTRPATARG